MFNSLFSSGGYDILQMVRPIADILFLSIIFYFTYRLFGDVKSRLLFNFFLIVILTYIAASVLRLETLLWVLKGVVGWLIIGAFVIFQPELRSLIFKKNYTLFLKPNKRIQNILDFTVIQRSVEFLVKMHRGALFVFPRTVQLSSVISTRIEVDARLSAEILQTIFSHDTPLHDGAVILENNRLTYAGCYLPLEKSSNIIPELGSRHRAALSLTNNSDAIVLIVSEQNGAVSLACNGELFYDIGVEKTCQYAAKLLLGQNIEVSWIKNYVKTVASEIETQK